MDMSEGLIFLHVDDPGGLSSYWMRLNLLHLHIFKFPVIWNKKTYISSVVNPSWLNCVTDTGQGVLYTSDADGIVFSESLPNHVVGKQCVVHNMEIQVWLRLVKCKCFHDNHWQNWDS